MQTNSRSMKLSSRCTVAQYQALEAAEQREKIASFVVERFAERYLDPLEVDKSKKSGFTIMAVCCLMVETLESFSRGWINTRGRSEEAFCSFFCRWHEFERFRPVSQDFYKHVRCGLLHQAETTGGWRILRNGALLREKTINASCFATALRHVLGRYSDSLRLESWHSEVWRAFRKKMGAICSNAEA